MGTTLTGTTPQDTYDSLIKVTDNGPISGTLKLLSDGLGNDTALALSTGGASVTGTLAVSGNATFDTSTLFVDAANNRVGVGTATPTTPLDAVANSSANAFTLRTRSVSDDFSFVQFKNNAGTEIVSEFFGHRTAVSTGRLGFSTNNAGSMLERLSIGSDGFIRLTTNSGGIQFNGDTAAANALDDYEEGTWTIGVSFGGASVGVTTNANTGTYTKVGRQVTVNGYLELTSKGSSSGNARITGLPFTISNADSFYAAVSFWMNNITFANQAFAYGDPNTTNIVFQELTEAGVITSLTNGDFANNSSVIVSLTYFV